MSVKKVRENLEKQVVRELEQDLTDITVDRLQGVIEQKKKEIIDDIEEYLKEYRQPLLDRDGYPCRDKNGNIVYEKVIKGIPTFIIDQVFFRSLNPINNKEPRYSAEKIGIVFSLYQYVIKEVNIKIGTVIPNKTHFCMFAGITQSTYNAYKRDSDRDMQVVMEKIDDYLSNAQFSMAQEGKLREKTTLDRLNIEMEKKKNYNPQVVVKADVKDISSYEKRMAELQELNIGAEYKIEDGE